MSDNEFRKQQAEKTERIDSTVSAMAKRVNRLYYWGGVLLFFGGCLVGFAGAVIKGNDWMRSLVKQDQLTRSEIRSIQRDSTLNAKIDTNYSRINHRVDNLPKIRFTGVIQRNGKEIRVY